MNDFVLTQDNYFSPEAMQLYMSNSQFKAFYTCSGAAMAELEERWKPELKDCFTEGHLFEAIVCGGEELFYMQHPEIISTRGESKGSPKANYLRVVEAAQAIRRQPAMMEIIERCEKQKIVTGNINGVPYKGCIDLYDPVTGDCWDTKCMKDFKGEYSPEEGRRLEWWEVYGYHRQAAIYRKLCRQMGIKTGRFGLMAATKEPVPDAAWLVFGEQLLDCALDVVYELSPMYQAMKIGMVEPQECGGCNYCRTVKILLEPTPTVQYTTIDEEDSDA